MARPGGGIGPVARLLRLERRHAGVDFGQIRRRLADGDPDGWKLFVERYSRTIYTLALRMSDYGADREEIAQEAYLAVLGRLGRDGARLIREFREEASIETYLFSAVRNEVASLRRGRSRLRSRTAPFVEESAAVSEGTTAESVGLDPERVATLVGRALDRLEPRERAVLRLRFARRLSFRRLAELFEWKDTNAAANEVARILRKLELLRRCREGLGWGEPERDVLLVCLRRWLVENEDDEGAVGFSADGGGSS